MQAPITARSTLPADVLIQAADVSSRLLSSCCMPSYTRTVRVHDRIVAQQAPSGQNSRVGALRRRGGRDAAQRRHGRRKICQIASQLLHLALQLPYALHSAGCSLNIPIPERPDSRLKPKVMRHYDINKTDGRSAL